MYFGYVCTFMAYCWPVKENPLQQNFFNGITIGENITFPDTNPTFYVHYIVVFCGKKTIKN